MQIGKVTTKYALILGGIALICTALSIAIYTITKQSIQRAMAQHQRELLLQVIPADYTDNLIEQNCVQNNSPLTRVCVGKKGDKITAYTIETTAPDGYSGDIRLLMGMTPEGEILGVRVIEHKETPGLGDKIETRISDWILSFSHQWINEKTLSQWKVKKDGGKFDQFAGATITPRAVVNQVRRAALALLQNQPIERFEKKTEQ